MYCYYTACQATGGDSSIFQQFLHMYNGSMTSDSSVFNAKENLSAVILAGGRGSRMGHSDKGLIMLAGRPLIAHVIERIAGQVAHIWINANRNLAEYQKYGYPVITDQNDDFMGPLAGIASALSDAQTSYLLVCPCDTPHPPTDLAQRLYNTLTEHDADIAVADDGERLHPVFCLIKTDLGSSLSEYLAQGGRKIDRWFDKLKTVRCDFSDKVDAFRNINTPEDLKRLETEMMNTNDSTPPIIGFCAHSGTGKTTLLKQIIPILKGRGFSLGIVKHAHHDFDTDQPGKDSYELRKAGAKNMLVSSSRRWTLINEHFGENEEATLAELIDIITHQSLDIVLVEGFKRETFPKIELHRRGLAYPYMYGQDPHVVALATDENPPSDVAIPILDINNPNQIADFIIEYCRL